MKSTLEFPLFGRRPLVLQKDSAPVGFLRDRPVWNLPNSPQGRFRILLVLIAIGVAILLLRLFAVQITEHEKYLRLANGNILRIVPLPPLRGPILDRNGEILVSNNMNFAVSIIQFGLKDDEDLVMDRLSRDLGVPVGMIEDTFDKVRDVLPPYLPIPVLSHLTIPQLARVQMDLWRLHGVVIQAIPDRHYMKGDLAAHLLGYVGSLSVADMKNSYARHFPPGTGIGKTGLEKQYDALLQGTPGEDRNLVNSQGDVVKKLDPTLPTEGHALKLTIDWRLQKVAEDALGDRKGAVVALDPRNGQVLVLASHPSYDPNQVSGTMSRQLWSSLLSDPRRPLSDRAIQGLYPPGSVFKIVTTMAGLDTGAIDPSRPFFCNGILRLHGWDFHDWKKGGHGHIHLRKAIMQSCDIFFYRAGMEIGPDKMASMARTFGLGAKTGIDLPSESTGTVPDRKWKKKRFGQPWYPGESLPFAIGQGYLTVTPLEMARLMAVVATQGLLVTPHLLMNAPAGSDKTVKTGLPLEHFGPVREGLWEVVNNPTGTGRPVKMKRMEIAGKTGTAQVISNRGPAHHKIRAHSWFVGFAPFSDPRIVVAVLIENGGDGGDTAGPVARQVFKTYYEDYLEAKAAPTLTERK